MKLPPGIREFLVCRGLGHKSYFHYTTLPILKKMLKSGKLYLSLGQIMNDLRELQKCNQEKWKRLYVMSFSYSNNESMAMWNIYGNPLDKALRLEFSNTNIKKLVSGDTLEVFKIISNTENDTYEFLCNTRNFEFVDIGYLHENNESLHWNKSTVSTKTCPNLTEITSQSNEEEDFAGFVKNIAWEYEKETRLLIELPEKLENYPDRIAIDCRNLWKNVKILCGPCLESGTLIQEIQSFYDTLEGENVPKIQIQIDDKHIVNSKNLWKVHFKHKCEVCDSNMKANCPLQKDLSSKEI